MPNSVGTADFQHKAYDAKFVLVNVNEMLKYGRVPVFGMTNMQYSKISNYIQNI